MPLFTISHPPTTGKNHISILDRGKDHNTAQAIPPIPTKPQPAKSQGEISPKIHTIERPVMENPQKITTPPLTPL